MASLHEIRICLEAIILQLEMIMGRVSDSSLDADLAALHQLAISTRDAADDLANAITP